MSDLISDTIASVYSPSELVRMYFTLMLFLEFEHRVDEIKLQKDGVIAKS